MGSSVNNFALSLVIIVMLNPGNLTMIRKGFLLLVVIALGFSSYNLYILENQRRAVKDDLVELSRIKYGLFSDDEWQVIISNLLAKKLEEFDFTPEQRAAMKGRITEFLDKTIADFESRYFEEKSRSLLGVIEGGVVNFTGMFDKIKKDVPVFTDQILDFLSKEDNRDKVKEFLEDKLKAYTDKNFTAIDYTEHDRILACYNFGDRCETIEGLTNEVTRIQKQQWIFIALLFPLIVLSALYITFIRVISSSEFIMYILICFILLANGLLLPMIDIDARISSIRFTLLGEPIIFEDQVLYYKSKSILEVVWLMLNQNEWKIFGVGILVLAFSVLFPISKLISSLFYVARNKVRHNKIARFFIFKTGKWSMADVMVVAIFMAYIGFSGILTEQLHQLEHLTRKVEILTTNKSSLQMGFFLFTSFVVLSLFLSHRLKMKEETNLA